MMRIHRKIGRAALVGAVLAAMLAAVTSQTAASAAGRSKPTARLSSRLQTIADYSSLSLNRTAQAATVGLPESGEASLMRSPNGRLVVDVFLTDASPAAIAQVTATGATFVAQDAKTPVATFEVDPSQLNAVGVLPVVKGVVEELVPMVNAACPSGDFISEGDGATQMNAANARTNFGVDGTGVSVGVMSDTFAKQTTLPPPAGPSTDVGNGELPGAGNPCGHTSFSNDAEGASNNTDEGRGMAQIVHDMAPGAEIRFATAFNSQVTFANNIRMLRDNGADVIVDDVTYFRELMYQDGFVSAAVNDVTSTGTVYYSSAANSTKFGTTGSSVGKSIGSYEATGGYRPTTCPAAVTTQLDCHDFDSGVGTDPGDDFLLPASANIRLTMDWSEPLLGVTTNLNVFLIDTVTNTIVASSQDNNPGVTQTPDEFINFTNSNGTARTYKMVIGRSAGTGTPRLKVLFHRATFTQIQWDNTTGGDVVGPTAFGHNANLVAGSTAAVWEGDNTFIEDYSSRGPATYCWQPISGAVAQPAISPCSVKQIDFAGTDGVQNSFFGGGTPHRFFGTSAAAPHAAGVAALMLDKVPCRTPAQILAAQRSTAHAVGTFGQDAMGSGRIDANLAIPALDQNCAPDVTDVSDINVNEGDVVNVTAPTVTTYPSGHSFTVSLSQTGGSAPKVIQSPTPTTRRFIAPKTATAAGETLSFDLTVTDSTNGLSTVVPFDVNVDNNVPVAFASGPSNPMPNSSSTATTGQTVQLIGASQDPIEPDQVPSGTTGRTYAWFQNSGPASVTLTPGSGSGFRNASFVPPVAGTYQFQLNVVDHGASGAISPNAFVSVVVRNAASFDTLSGIVKDETGAALSGVSVDVFAVGSAPVVASTTTNGAGGWSVIGLTNGGQYYVRFTKSGYGQRWAKDGMGATGVRSVTVPSALVDAVLTPTASLRSISGVATDAVGAGIDQLQVRLFDSVGLVATTTTNPTGNYAFNGLTQKGKYTIQLAPGSATFNTAWVTTDGLGALFGTTGASNLFFDTTSASVVVPTTKVFNKVTDNRNIVATVAGGGPVTGAEVRVYDALGYYVTSTRTNSFGAYTISGLRPAPGYKVWVWTKCNGCTAGALTSEWYNDVPGEQYDQSGKLSTTTDLTVSGAGLFFGLT